MRVPGPRTDVTIQEVSYSSDGKGGTIKTWTTKSTTTGYISGLRGYERIIAAQAGVTTDKRLYLDYTDENSAITTNDRAVVAGKT